MLKKVFYSLLLIFILPTCLRAQNGDTSIMESLSKLDSTTVKVHSNRRAHMIMTNPMPIVIVSQKELEQTISSNIIDALVTRTPGLSVVKTGPNISKPFIRGLGYNRVLTFYDGIRQEGQQWGDEHGIELDGYNMSGAEIIKGPASTLYGSDALAGVVSFKPIYPLLQDDRWHGNIQSEYQSNNNLIGNGAYISYNGKRFFASASGSYKMAKDYRNAIDGRVYNTNFKEANAAFLLGYHFKKGYITLNGTLYHNLQGIPDGSRDSLTRMFTKQIAEGEEDDMNTRPIVSDKELNSYSLSELHQLIKHYRLYSKFFREVGNGNIQATIAFQQNNRVEYSHPTIPSQAGMDMQLQTFNYDFRMEKRDIVPNFNLNIGSNGMYQVNKNLDATDFPIPDYKLADGGIFIFGKWHKEKWTISGGVRWDMRHVKWHDFYTVEDANTGFERKARKDEYVIANKQFEGFSKNYSGISSSLGATYRASQNWNLKFNIARGYRVPNMTELASNGLDPGAHIVYLGNTSFKPEFSLQQDLGVSAYYEDWDMDLSVFNNNISNYIFLSMKTGADGLPITDAQGNKTYQYQQSKAQLYGAEVFVSLHPRDWKGFSWNTSFATVYGFNRSVLFRNKGTDGSYLPFIPPTRIVTSLHWTLFENKTSLLASITPQYECEWDAAQNRFLGLNSTETATSSYVLHSVGIQTSWRGISGKNIYIGLMVNNLFDKVYQSNMSRLKYLEYYSNSTNEHYGIYNMGRNISIKMVLPL